MRIYPLLCPGCASARITVIEKGGFCGKWKLIACEACDKLYQQTNRTLFDSSGAAWKNLSLSYTRFREPCAQK